MPKQLPDIKVPPMEPGQEVVVDFVNTGMKVANSNTAKDRFRFVAPGTYVEPPPPPPPDPDPGGWEVPFGTRTKSGKIHISDATDVVIEGKFFDKLGTDVEAIRLVNVRGGIIRANDWRDVAQGITFSDCSDITIEWGRYRNIIGPYERVGKNRANFLQAMRSERITVRNVKGIGGDTEDVISLYKTSFSLVEDVHLEGLHANRDGMLAWRSSSGTGVLLSDGGGQGNVGRRIKVVNVGQVGIGIAGGLNSRVEDCIAISQARVSPQSNVGFYVLNYAGTPDNRPACSGHVLIGNRANWKRYDGVANGYYGSKSTSSKWCGKTLTDNDFKDESLDIDDYRVVL